MPILHSRRCSLRAVAATLALPLASFAFAFAQSKEPIVEVWKSPNCGCCKDWVWHLQANGFRTEAHDVGNTAMRAKLGIPIAYGSCHTARIDGYAIEGHVPAGDIRRLLKVRPEVVGLTVPGMPIGSPGMDGQVYGGRRDPYDVLLIGKGGEAAVYRSYR